MWASACVFAIGDSFGGRGYCNLQGEHSCQGAQQFESLICTTAAKAEGADEQFGRVCGGGAPNLDSLLGNSCGTLFLEN